ncbi:MAG: hypothetical protein ACODAE_10710 [Gemmatimonadota bacterium]
MRRFIDGDGREWDVVLGRESWGAHYALFVPRGSGRRARARQTLLDASGYGAAEIALARMDEAAVARLFERSEPRAEE